jgi:hypothetical protein
MFFYVQIHTQMLWTIQRSKSMKYLRRDKTAVNVGFVKRVGSVLQRFRYIGMVYHTPWRTGQQSASGG